MFIITFIELDDGEIYRKPLFLMVKTMVSCRFSLKPIHWYLVIITSKIAWAQSRVPTSRPRPSMEISQDRQEARLRVGKHGETHWKTPENQGKCWEKTMKKPFENHGKTLPSKWLCFGKIGCLYPWDLVETKIEEAWDASWYWAPGLAVEDFRETSPTTNRPLQLAQRDCLKACPWGSEGTTRVPYTIVHSLAFLFGLLVSVCVSRYALLAWGRAFRLYAVGFLFVICCLALYRFGCFL